MKPEDIKKGEYYAIDDKFKSVFICSGHVSVSIPSEIYINKHYRNYDKRGTAFYVDLDTVRPATPQEIAHLDACIAADMYVDEPESTKFLKGEYIVLLDLLLHQNAYKNHWCYKQRDSDIHFNSELDNNGGKYNGWVRFTKKDTSNWRYATTAEAAEYERLGKPYDVTTLNQEEFTFRYTGELMNAVYCDNKEEYECLIDFLKREDVILNANPYNGSGTAAIGEHQHARSGKSSWTCCTKERFANDTSIFKTYSFKEYQAKLATIGINLFLVSIPAFNVKAEFQAGEYIVILKSYPTNHFHKNHIFKQAKNRECVTYGIYSTNSDLIKADTTTWRYATPEEVAEYERVGKPYDVTTLCSPKKEEFIEGGYYTVITKYGTTVLKSDYTGESTRRANYLFTGNKYFKKDGHGHFIFEKDYKKSTQEEVIWLDSCIEAGEYMSKEDALEAHSDAVFKQGNKVKNDFAVGDIVECIDVSGCIGLRLHEHYVVNRVCEEYIYLSDQVNDGYFKHRFKLIKDVWINTPPIFSPLRYMPTAAQQYGTLASNVQKTEYETGVSPISLLDIISPIKTKTVKKPVEFNLISINNLISK